MNASEGRCAPAPSPMIVVDSLQKSFPVAYGVGAWVRHRGRPPRRTALHDVSFTVGRGELFGLLGPNGAGKTTLLKLLATLSVPESGRVVIDGVDLASDPLRAKHRLALCSSEERSFYYRLTARANLRFFGRLAGLRGAALDARIAEVVALVDLGDSIDKRFDGYSSGMRQRLTVARALLGDPSVILLDEPTRAVDPVHTEDLRRFIRSELVERQGKTVVLATNVLEEAWRMCDRVAVLSGGRLVALGPPRSLDAALRAVLRFEVTLDHADEALLERMRAVAGFVHADVAVGRDGEILSVTIEPGERSLTELLRAVSANGAVLRRFKEVDAEPVDVFRQITNGSP